VLISEFSLDISEPSGLSLYEDGNLICVSDQTGMAYVITPNGVSLENFSLTGQDLEGIHFNPVDQRTYHVNEATGELYMSDADFNLISTWSIIAPDTNQGLEGCCLDSASGIVYLVKERSPRLLILFDIESQIGESYPLDFAQDYSGIAYNSNSDRLYIISDASRSLSICSTIGEELQRFDLCIEKAEGIAIDTESERIYIVSDKTEKLYVFELP
jgi:uncharacterized protein YjiK